MQNMEGSSAMKSRRAIVVDDTLLERRLSIHALHKYNFDSFEAFNGKEVVDRFLSGQKFDLVLMGKSANVFDGLEATRRLRKMGAECKIIALMLSDEYKDSFVEAGADEFLTKPLDRMMLKEVLKKLELID